MGFFFPFQNFWFMIGKNVRRINRLHSCLYCINAALSLFSNSEAFLWKKWCTYGQVWSICNRQVSALWIQAMFQIIKHVKGILLVFGVSLATDVAWHLKIFHRSLPVLLKKGRSWSLLWADNSADKNHSILWYNFTQRSFYTKIFDILCFQIHWSTLYAPMSNNLQLSRGWASLEAKRKDRRSSRETQLLLLRSRAQRSIEMERTSLIISSSHPKPTKLLNLSNSFHEAMKFLPYFSIPQDHLQLLAQKPALFSSAHCFLRAWGINGKTISPSAQRLGKPGFIGHLQQEWFILLNILVALICAFSSLNPSSECGWPELY